MKHLLSISSMVLYSKLWKLTQDETVFPLSVKLARRICQSRATEAEICFLAGSSCTLFFPIAVFSLSYVYVG